MFGEEAMTPKEIKLKGPRMKVTKSDNEDEKVTKDIIEIERLQAVYNLRKYQKETKGLER